MYQRTIRKVIVLMMAVIWCSVGMNGCEKKAKAAETSPPATATSKTPEGNVVVKEEVLNVLVESPGEHFHKAR
jgi:hypothetical protein